jgi:flagellar biosynthesis protein FlhF
MQLHTFRARSIQEALLLVRQELGPDASVLETREVGSAIVRWFGGRQIEVTATADDEMAIQTGGGVIQAADIHDYRGEIRAGLLARAADEPSLVEQLASAASHRADRGHSAGCGALRHQLHAAGVAEPTAKRWLDRLQAELACDPDRHPDSVAGRLRQIIASDLPVRGPIRLSPGQTTVVALVGPTGVGKTTTLAKLAARFRLHERRSVGLITIDTYRIAAVEQLRTYAQIMDLPMEVVATPREMRSAVERLSENDLVLIDTAGRSPRDEARLQELRALLAEAQPDEVHLVLGCIAGAESLRTAARAFVSTGANSLILTKLDEAWQTGGFAEWLGACRLPLSYTTHGQNVPDDIHPASALKLAELILPGSPR